MTSAKKDGLHSQSTPIKPTLSIPGTVPSSRTAFLFSFTSDVVSDNNSCDILFANSFTVSKLSTIVTGDAPFGDGNTSFSVRHDDSSDFGSGGGRRCGTGNAAGSQAASCNRLSSALL